MKIEESIKNLKEIIDCGYDKNTTAVLDYIDIKSLEIVLNKLKELDDDLYSANCMINEQIDLLRDSISKDTIKEKIEELAKEYNKYAKKRTNEDRIFTMEKLLYQINILKELLLEDK